MRNASIIYIWYEGGQLRLALVKPDKIVGFSHTASSGDIGERARRQPQRMIRPLAH